MPNETTAFASSHRQKKTWLTVLAVLAVLVVFATVAALTMPASAMTAPATPETAATGETAAPESTALPQDNAAPSDTAQSDTVTEQAAAETAALPAAAQVPEGYTVQRTVRDEENGFAVTVYAPEGVIPEGAALSATLLTEGDEAYQQAEQALAEENDGTGYGFAALDIHLEDADGNEVKPNGDVFVSIDAIGLLPDDADPDSVTVQHHAEAAAEAAGTAVTVETVADTADETDGVVEVTPAAEATESTTTLEAPEGETATEIQAAFTVDGFSTFTITWEMDDWWDNESVTVYYVDQNGQQIQGSQTTDVTCDADEWVDLDSYATEIEGYTYQGAHLNSYDGTEARWVTYQSSGQNRWRYSNGDNAPTDNGSQWWVRHEETRSIYLVYSEPVRVYVYVAGEGLSDECLELLGIDRDTLDQNGYFPAGEISLDPSYFARQDSEDVNTAGQPLINSAADWQELLTALSNMDTSNLANKEDRNVWRYNYDRIDYTSNIGNHVGEYLSQARGDIGQTWGSDCTALFRWHDNPYTAANVHCGFVDQEVDYHLDLFFTTNTIRFVYGNNWESPSDYPEDYLGDLTDAVDPRTYITGTPIQDPGTIPVPQGYSIEGYYNEPNFETRWDGIGDPLNEDEVVYIKLTENRTLSPLLIEKEVSGYNLTDAKDYSFTISTNDSNVAGKSYSISGDTGDAEAIQFSETANNQNYYTATVTMANVTSDNGTDGAIYIWGLPVGSTYTITENADSASIDGYTCSADYSVRGGMASTDSATVTTTANEYNTATVEVTNTYTESETTGDLTIVKYINGLDNDQVVSLLNGDYRQLNPSTSDESGLRFDVDYFEEEEYLKNDGADVPIPEGGVAGNPYRDDWNEGDWTFDVSDTVEETENPIENWSQNITPGGNSISQNEVEHYDDVSITKLGEKAYRYEITIHDVDLQKWYRVWELHMDVPGYTLSSTVEESLTGQGDDSLSNLLGTEGYEEGNHGGRATAFKMTGDTTVVFTNTYSQGELDITKQLAGLTDQTTSSEEFTFTVSIPSAWAQRTEYNNGEYSVTYVREGSETKHSDGIITFSVPEGSDNATVEIMLYPGETATISLPTGIYPTVTETIAEGAYSVTWNNETTPDADNSFTTMTPISADTPVTVTCTNTPVTVDVTIVKVDSDNNALSGAEFQLTNGSGQYYTVSGTGEEATVSWGSTPFTLTSQNNVFSIQDLPNGTYTLTETKAPDGYQLLTSGITITVHNGRMTISPNGTGAEYASGDKTITVPNQTGAVLPSTGGTGTTFLTFGGLLMMAAAVGGYALRRRRGKGAR